MGGGGGEKGQQTGDIDRGKDRGRETEEKYRRRSRGRKQRGI